jgi:hypothetical protein
MKSVFVSFCLLEDEHRRMLCSVAGRTVFVAREPLHKTSYQRFHRKHDACTFGGIEVSDESPGHRIIVVLLLRRIHSVQDFIE